MPVTELITLGSFVMGFLSVVLPILIYVFLASHKTRN